jgi:hypothetical protein
LDLGDLGLNVGTVVIGVAVALILYGLYQFVMFGIELVTQARVPMPTRQRMALRRLKRAIISMVLMFAIIWIFKVLGIV